MASSSHFILKLLLQSLHRYVKDGNKNWVLLYHVKGVGVDYGFVHQSQVAKNPTK